MIKKNYLSFKNIIGILKYLADATDVWQLILIVLSGSVIFVFTKINFKPNNIQIILFENCFLLLPNKMCMFIVKSSRKSIFPFKKKKPTSI